MVNLLPQLVILAFVGLNLLYVAFACPFDLSPDEAHYWDWSRRLGYCYYSKGPLVALLIRGSCELFGNTPFAVRLPAVLCGGLLLLGLHRLALRATADSRLSLGVLLVALTLPPVAVGSVLMTIDPPFLACWVWAAVLFPSPLGERGRGEEESGPVADGQEARLDTQVPLPHATPRPQGRGGLAAALLVAVGTLAKSTMLLFPLCVFGWLVATRQLRRAPVGFFAVSLLGLVPIVWWNALHQWIGLRHALGHAGAGEPWAGVGGVLTFLGGQFGLLLGVWFVFWAVAVISRLRSFPSLERRARGEISSFLWWLSVPVFAVFLLVSVRSPGQPNWPLPSYVTGAILVAVWLKPRLSNRYVRRSLLGAILVGAVGGMVLRFPGPLRPSLAGVLPAPSDARPAPVRQLDPTARLLGWKHLAERVDAVRDRIKSESNLEPLIAGMTWVLPGELGFYCRGNPVAYTFGLALADRASQYDVWRPNPVADAQEFRGATFVYVGEAIPDAAFEQVTLAEAVVARENGIPVANWKIWVCRGFRGFDAAADRRHPYRY